MEVLLVIDMQNDFMPGGSLAVEDGDRIVPVVNRLMEQSELVVATQDWHPENHSSFASQHVDNDVFDAITVHGNDQILWPDHCVQGSKGADFHPLVKTSYFEAVFRKGTNVAIDSYSGFYDNNHEKSTGLSGYFREKGIEEIDICGLAADFCVYYTIVDALAEGFSVRLHSNATKPIDATNFKNQLKELKKNKKFCVS